MSLRIEVEWSYTGPSVESLDFRRVLYAYLHPNTNDILYLGKADRCSVRGRFGGEHKEAIFSNIITEHRLATLHAIVGVLSAEQRFSSELLSDVESLLIMATQPPYNRQSKKSRICRPGLNVKCVGDWPLGNRVYKDE